MMFKLLDLFSGVGGFSVGLERVGFETIAFCEIDGFARRVLRKNWPDVRQYEDVRTLTASQLAADGLVPDAICGGFPCQDISLVGRMSGLGGAKSGLWAEFLRLISEIKPRVIIIENSPVLRSRGLEQILSELATLRYDAEWHCIPANAIGAPHRRDRVWVIAYPARVGNGLPQEQILTGRHIAKHSDWWASEPQICRVDDGTPGRVDRLEKIGNSVVPQIPELIGRAILNSVSEGAK